MQDLMTLGNLLPADLILTGSIRMGIEDIEWPGDRREAYATATVRAFETATGRIIWAARCTATTARFTGVHHTGTNSELLQMSIEELAQKIAQSLFDTPAEEAQP